MKLLNPCIDPVFKALFTDNSDEARLALTSFLSAVLERDVSKVELTHTELPIESDNSKQSLFDLTCVLDGTEPVNVEMQGINVYETFDMRAEYHVAHLLNHFVPKGTDWNEITKAYQISVLNFIYDDTHDDVCTLYNMRSKNGSRLADRLNIYFIELPKVLNKSENPKELSKIERWSKFFAYADDENKQEYISQLIESEEGIMNARTVLCRISTDDAMWVKMNSYYDALAREATLQNGYEKGVAKGIERGIAKGIEQGIAKGIEQGEYNQAKKMARNMLMDNESIDKIQKYTGLSETEINQLRQMSQKH